LEALESALEIRPEQPSTERSLLILLSYVQIMCCATFDICFDYGNINYQQLMEKNQNYLPSVSQMHGKEMEMSRRLGSDISSNDMEWALYMNTWKVCTCLSQVWVNFSHLPSLENPIYCALFFFFAYHCKFSILHFIHSTWNALSTSKILSITWNAQV